MIFCLNSRLKLDSYHITRAHFIPNHSPSLYRSLPNPIFISVSDTLRQIFVSSCLRSEVNFWESFLLIIIIKHIQHPSTRYRIVYRTLKISTRLLVLDMKLSDWVHIDEQAWHIISDGNGVFWKEYIIRMDVRRGRESMIVSYKLPSSLRFLDIPCFNLFCIFNILALKL